jgi:ubiquinone biosynthesis protein COQ4
MGHPVLAKVKALRGFLMLVRDPRDIAGVFSIVDAIRTPADVQPMIDWFERDAVGRRALAERRKLVFDRDALGRLPEGTLGRAFADHLRVNGFDPSDFPALPVGTQHEFVSAHLYDTHDIWHVVTGFGTDVAGELGLQAFYLAQFPSKLGVTLLAAGMLNTLGPQGFDDREHRMEEVVRGWLLGRASRSLFGAPWDELWALPLAEVRARYGIDRDGVQARLTPAA